MVTNVEELLPYSFGGESLKWKVDLYR
jgi:hypothetical protein